MAKMKKITQHYIKTKINEARPLVQEERLVQQHFMERNQLLRHLRQQILPLSPPLLQATPPKLAFFVAHESKLVRRRHHLLPVNIVELETKSFDFAFDVPPKNGLHPFQRPGKQPALEPGANVLGNDLRMLADFQSDPFAFA